MSITMQSQSSDYHFPQETYLIKKRYIKRPDKYELLFPTFSSYSLRADNVDQTQSMLGVLLEGRCHCGVTGTGFIQDPLSSCQSKMNISWRWKCRLK